MLAYPMSRYDFSLTQRLPQKGQLDGTWDTSCRVSGKARRGGTVVLYPTSCKVGRHRAGRAPGTEAVFALQMGVPTDKTLANPDGYDHFRAANCRF